MALLIHNGFEFGHILKGGYIITEDIPDIISEQTMADGSIRKNYGKSDKTKIKVKFSQTNKTIFKEYMQHLNKHEDFFTYYSPKKDEMITKRFAITPPTTSVLLSIKDNRYEEFEIELSQVGEGDN